MEKRSFWIGGKHSVLSALNNENRKIQKIVIGNENNIKEIPKKNHSLLTFSTNEKISKFFEDKQFMHQGYAALIEPKTTLEVKNIFLHNEKMNKNILILDGVTDIRNIGSIIRTAVSQEINFIILEKRIYKKSASLHKASSGAIENINIVLVSNISQAILELKKNNYWITGMSGSSPKEITTHQWSKKNAIVMGSEDKGIKKNIQSNCDFLIKIPISKKIDSLNVSNACAITLFHLKHFS